MKNCGQHNAILAGMKYADGDYILGMDDDFQTRPLQIILKENLSGKRIAGNMLIMLGIICFTLL